MSSSLTISKSANPRKSEDYYFLRKEGLSYIERLGNKIWTDYNIHDPGITILEMLAYAITDLDYRTSYDIRDLLALRTDGTLKTCDTDCPKYFHTANDILTVNPITINDYRKLIIDVEGVRNAWMILSKESELQFYVDLDKSELTYESGPASDPNPEIILNGLYKVLLEFEEDDEYGDLNDPVIEWPLLLPDEELEVKFVFPHWTELIYPSTMETGCLGPNPTHTPEIAQRWIRYGTITNIGLTPADICFEPELRLYRARVQVDFDYEIPNPPPDPGFECYTDMEFDAEAGGGGPMGTTAGSDTFHLDIEVMTTLPLADIEAELIDLLTDNATERIVAFFQEKLKATIDIVDHVRCRLMNHRNLCEDFLRIESLKSEEIALCADIEIDPRADVDEVLAEIYYQVGNFISPPINFYTLEEMFDKGKKSDEIFNGPILSHGFIDNAELDAAILRAELRTSDIINIIMDIEGVVAVREMLIANYVDGQPVYEGEQWILPLKGDGLHVPKLSPDKSKILFFRDVLPFRANEERVLELLGEKQAKNQKVRLKEISLDIPVPEGDDLEVDTYQTIQNDFPLTYGIGRDGIPGSPDDARKAKAIQLKGFLLFFDQLLANYMAQLDHVAELFSMDPASSPQTYFVQAIQDLRDVEDLYIDHNNVDEFDVVEDYLVAISENDELREDRKNRFLDHLMARFAESFSEYSLLMFNLQEAIAPAELIQDKQAFLQDYPEISRNRAKAFNYRPLQEDCLTCNPEELWNTRDNVSGYKKRVSRLLGIDDYYRRNLTCHCFAIHEIDYGDGTYGYVWYMKDPDETNPANIDPMTHQGILLRSVEYETEDSANFMITYAIAMIEEGRLEMIETPAADVYECCEKVGVTNVGDIVPTTGHRFVVKNPCDAIIACSGEYASVAAMEPDFEKARDWVLHYCTVEGFHLIEHILLRPKYNEDPLDPAKHDHFLPVCLDHKTEAIEAEAVPDLQIYQKLYFEIFLDGSNNWQFIAKNHNGTTVLFSQATKTRRGYKDLRSAKHGVGEVKKYRLQESNYSLKQTGSGRHYYELVANNGEVIAESRKFSNTTDRNKDLNALRCFNPAVSPAETAAAAESRTYCVEDADPYSFRMSIVLPSWAGRFKDINYRQLVEKTMRLEAPAHISLKICWIDRDQMAEFECAYMEWLEANGACDATPESVSPKLNTLIEVMHNLKNVYPVATLHDCDDAVAGSSPVVLNFTSLGTL